MSNIYILMNQIYSLIKIYVYINTHKTVNILEKTPQKINIIEGMTTDLAVLRVFLQIFTIIIHHFHSINQRILHIKFESYQLHVFIKLTNYLFNIIYMNIKKVLCLPVYLFPSYFTGMVQYVYPFTCLPPKVLDWFRMFASCLPQQIYIILLIEHNTQKWNIFLTASF